MPTGGTGSLLLLALPLILLVFLMWSQRRRMREQERIQAGLQVGQEVMTSSGMYGRLVGLEDAVATIEVAPGVQVRFDRRAVTAPPAGRPSPEAPASGEDQ